MELPWRETLYTSSIKDLLRVFSEKLSIKRTFLREQCLLSYLVPVFAVSFNLVLFVEQVSTLGHLCRKWQVLLKLHILASAWQINGDRSLKALSEINTELFLHGYCFFPGWKTAFSGSLTKIETCSRRLTCLWQSGTTRLWSKLSF